MDVRCFTVGPVAENCYVVRRDGSDRALIVDPGEEAERILGAVDQLAAVSLTQGIPQDAAKKIVKAIKEGGFKKTQASIQGDEIRVTSPSKDELQAVIAMLRGGDFGIELTFANYRG